MKGELTGGCLCGQVRYRLTNEFRMLPYACHCTDCQSRTGSAFSEHMLVGTGDVHLEGETDCGWYVQPSRAKSQIVGCAQCKTSIYAINDERPGMASLRCGTLDRSAEVEPHAHIWVRSKQPWIVLPPDALVMAEQPRTNEEWMALVWPK